METTFFQTREGDRVVSEIEFGADQKDGGSWSVVPDFGDPLAGAREGISVEQRRGGREHGKDLLSIFQNVFFFFNNDLEMQRSKIDKAGKWSALDCSFERKAVPGTPDSSRIHESKTPLTYSFDIFETWWGDD